jgi:hypothetical protein
VKKGESRKLIPELWVKNMFKGSDFPMGESENPNWGERLFALGEKGKSNHLNEEARGDWSCLFRYR